MTEEELTVILKDIGNKFYFQVINDKFKNNKITEVTTNEVTIQLNCTCKFASLNPNNKKLCKHQKEALKKLLSM